jgi:hypothetical protein
LAFAFGDANDHGHSYMLGGGDDSLEGHEFRDIEMTDGDVAFVGGLQRAKESGHGAFRYGVVRCEAGGETWGVLSERVTSLPNWMIEGIRRITNQEN